MRDLAFPSRSGRRSQREDAHLWQFPSQRRYIAAEITFFDRDLTPNTLHQAVLVDGLPIVFNELEQDIENLRCERHRHAVAQQTALFNVDAKSIEFVKEF